MSDLVKYGYATGDYHGVCFDCKAQHYNSDKRSIRCKSCAQALRIAELESERDGAYAAGVMASAEVAYKHMERTGHNGSDESDNPDLVARGYGNAALNISHELQSLATLPPGYVCVKVEPDQPTLDAMDAVSPYPTVGYWVSVYRTMITKATP